MATYTAILAGGDWNTNATWGGTGHPVAGDTANITNVTSSNIQITTTRLNGNVKLSGNVKLN